MLNELNELLELRPDPIIGIEPGGRVLAYATQSSEAAGAGARTPEPGAGLFREEVTVFFGEIDADTNVRAALRTCKALIVAGFEVDAAVPTLSNCFVITAWRDVAKPASYLEEEIDALVAPFDGEVTLVEQMKSPNIVYVPG